MSMIYFYREYAWTMEENNGNIRFLSVISYIGVLFIIGHFSVEKNNPDLRFHTIQGGVLCVFYMVLYILDFLLSLVLMMIPAFGIILTVLITIAIALSNLILVIIGISYAVTFRQGLLPFVGKAALALRTRLDGAP